MRRCRAPVFVKALEPLKLKEFDRPQLGPGEALVRMKLAGICGTDVHLWRNPETPSPMIFGHENVGVIEELGRGTVLDALGQELQVGDLVVFGGKMPCGRCQICVLAQEPTSCERGIGYGISPIHEAPYLRGGYGEYVHLVALSGVIRVPEERYTEEALMAVIGNRTILHGLERMGGLQAGESVLIQGSGPIGLAALIQAKLAGAGRVVVIGAPEERLKAAKELGADGIISIEEIEEPSRRVRKALELNDGHGFDVVMECSGGESAVEEGIEAARVGGRYLVIGQATDYGARPINPYIITKKQLKLYGCWAATAKHLYKALQLLIKARLPLRRLITHRFAMEEATEGLRVVERLASIIAVIDHQL